MDPRVLKGRSAYALGLIGIRVAVLVVVLSALLGIASFVPITYSGPVLGSIFQDCTIGVLVLGCPLILRLAYALKARQAAEVSAGYTTIWRDYAGVDELHPTSGQVIRRADEPLLSQVEFRRLMVERSNPVADYRVE